MAYNIFRASSPQMPQMQNVLGPGYDPGYEAPLSKGYTMPPEPDEYMREELGDELFRQYQNMDRNQRLRFLNDPANGFVPPSTKKPNVGLPNAPMSRFNDAAAYRTADSGQVISDAAAFKPMTDDNVSMRRFQDLELSQRTALTGLQTIMDQLRESPQVLDDVHTLTGRAATGALAFRDRLGIDALDIGPEQEQRVGDVASYRQRLLTNVNSYIKEITGAQVGQGAETQRLMAVQPNENDSPSQLLAKLQGAMDMARLNIARYRYMQATGESEPPTDQQLRQILIERGRFYAQAAQQQGLEGDEARMWAAQKLSEEFGL